MYLNVIKCFNPIKKKNTLYKLTFVTLFVTPGKSFLALTNLCFITCFTHILIFYIEQEQVQIMFFVPNNKTVSI